MIFNEKLHVVALVATMMALGAQAASVSSNEVIGAVSAWSSVNGTTFARRGEPTSAEAVHDDDGATVLYWIVRMSDGSAVIASPDSDLDLVVAVVERFSGEFPEGHPLPSILKADMAKRLSVIGLRRAASIGGRRSAAGASAASVASVPADVEASVAAANAQWAKYGVGGSGARTQALALEGGDESPYVRRIVDGFESGGRYTHWNQGLVNGRYCYNKYTPGNAVCGCVATAGSAILQFFNCTNDVGTVSGNPTYIGEPAEARYSRTMAGSIDWSILPKSYGGAKEGSDVLDDAGVDLLGRVAFNIGVLVDMGWDAAGPGTESGAYTKDLVKAFKAYGFKTARHVTFNTGKDADNENQFTKTVYAQNWCGAPVVLGIDGSSGGHAVIACGYARDPDGDQFCRVFMGWSGSDDAWYRFPTVQSYSLVDGAVTMIGLEDDAVVPVYGSANIPGVDLEVPGYVTNGVTVTAPVNANGFFGVRVPPSTADLRIGYAPRARYAPISPFDSDVLADESADRETLDAAIPDEIELSVLNTDVRYTLESAKAVAVRDGKALLLVSGTSGGLRSNALMEYIYWLDETTDMSNRYVIVYNNVKSSDANRPDGDPALGVFDPNVYEPGERWTESNGRLAYENFIEAVSEETGDIVYTFSETNTVAITNTVLPAMAKGYDSYLRNVSGITVTVAGVDTAAEGDGTCEVGDVTCGYGVTANSWTNGEYAVFSAPAAVTNRDDGVIMACLGWTTNEVGSTGTLGGLVDGTEAEIRLFSGDDVTLTWVWEASHYLVKAAADDSSAAFASAVTPAESWVEAGGVATVKAEAKVGTYAFSEWDVSGASGTYDDESSNVDYYYENATAVSFIVDEPVTVSAVYRNGAAAPEDPIEFTFTLKASPSDLQGELPAPSGFAWGPNTGYSPVVSLSCADSFTDSTGGVWVCKGWLVGSATSSSTRLRTYATGEIVSVWEPESGEEPVDLGEISITSLAHGSDGTWTIEVSGAKAGAWYWLYATDDLSKFTGDEATWTAALEPAEVAEGTNPRQATEDGTVTFKATGGGGSLFWRARATLKETGD